MTAYRVTLVRFSSAACKMAMIWFTAILFTATSSLAKDVVFALDAPRPQGRHAPYFLALEKGYYREAGLDVAIVPGRGSADGINRVASREVTFAFGDAGSLVLAQSKGVKAKMVAVVYAASPFVIFSLTTTPITSPKDLEGKTIAAPPTDGMRTMFPVFAQVAGIDASKVRWIDVPIEKKDQALLTREVDGMTSGLQQLPSLSNAARAKRLEVQTLRWSDYGFALYSNGILASDELIEADPMIVRGFVQATVRGLTDAFADPGAASKMMTSRFPDLDPETVRAEIEIIREAALTDATRRDGIGFIDEKAMQATADAVADVFSIKRPQSRSLYTNAFLR